MKKDWVVVASFPHDEGGLEESRKYCQRWPQCGLDIDGKRILVSVPKNVLATQQPETLLAMQEYAVAVLLEQAANLRRSAVEWQNATYNDAAEMLEIAAGHRRATLPAARYVARRRQRDQDAVDAYMAQQAKNELMRRCRASGSVEPPEPPHCDECFEGCEKCGLGAAHSTTGGGREDVTCVLYARVESPTSIVASDEKGVVGSSPKITHKDDKRLQDESLQDYALYGLW